jgi:hypothetical protein
MKTKLFFLFAFITFNCMGQEVPVKFNELPRVAQDFINKYFPDNFHHGIKEVESRKITYTVFMNDDTEIEFTEAGRWTEIEGDNNKIPYTFIQKPILDYIKQNYPKQFITKIELEQTGYDVELDNGIDLEFDASGLFIKVD